jgi:hypothetical protein
MIDRGNKRESDLLTPTTFAQACSMEDLASAG